MKMEKSPYHEGVQYLFGLQKYGIKFGLSKTSNMMSFFGNPHHGRKYLHIGGTNGKGSVAAFVASVLQSSGLKVGLYTSPHLVRFTERFRINGKEIPRQKALSLIRELKSAFSRKELPTFFEATTAMALLYFAREDTDVAIMEVGMGGRLDATNIISPLVSVITNISMEHQNFLGSCLLDIAGEKGGIIKEGVDLVSGVTQPAVKTLFRSICDKKGSSFFRLGRDFTYRNTGSGLNYYGIERRLKGLDIGLLGGFQSKNAAIALAAVERVEKKGFSFSDSRIRDGLSKTRWPGRMQLISENPMIVLDGAHNPGAIRELARSLRTSLSFRKMILVIGVMEDKDIKRMLGSIVPLADHVIYTRPVYSRAAEPDILARKGSHLGVPGEVVPYLKEAVQRAKGLARSSDLILICGSLFTVGEAMSHLDPHGYGKVE